MTGGSNRPARDPARGRQKKKAASPGRWQRSFRGQLRPCVESVPFRTSSAGKSSPPRATARDSHRSATKKTSRRGGAVRRLRRRLRCLSSSYARRVPSWNARPPSRDSAIVQHRPHDPAKNSSVRIIARSCGELVSGARGIQMAWSLFARARTPGRSRDARCSPAIAAGRCTQSTLLQCHAIHVLWKTHVRETCNMQPDARDARDARRRGGDVPARPTATFAHLAFVFRNASLS